MSPEEKIHVNILHWIRRHAPSCLVFHPPNGGGRTMHEAVRMQKLGVLAGVSDLIIIPPGGIIHCLEIKREKGGRPSTAQIAFMRRIEVLGGQTRLARGIEDVRSAFTEWGIETI